MWPSSRLLVLAMQKFHGEMDALEMAAFDGQIARLGRAGAKNDGIKFAQAVFPPDNLCRPRCWR